MSFRKTVLAELTAIREQLASFRNTYDNEHAALARDVSQTKQDVAELARRAGVLRKDTA
jgi:hypothetical protein